MAIPRDGSSDSCYGSLVLCETVYYESVQHAYEGPFHALRDVGTIYWLKRFFETFDQLFKSSVMKSLTQKDAAHTLLRLLSVPKSRENRWFEGSSSKINPSGIRGETEDKMRTGNVDVGLCIRSDRLPNGSLPK